MVVDKICLKTQNLCKLQVLPLFEVMKRKYSIHQNVIVAISWCSYTFLCTSWEIRTYISVYEQAKKTVFFRYSEIKHHLMPHSKITKPH